MLLPLLLIVTNTLAQSIYDKLKPHHIYSTLYSIQYQNYVSLAGFLSLLIYDRKGGNWQAVVYYTRKTFVCPAVPSWDLVLSPYSAKCVHSRPRTWLSDSNPATAMNIKPHCHEKLAVRAEDADLLAGINRRLFFSTIGYSRLIPHFPCADGRAVSFKDLAACRRYIS